MWLEEAVGALEPDERELIELAFYQGHSHGELAELTGRPLGSIKSRLRGALAKLRTKLGDAGTLIRTLRGFGYKLEEG